MPMSINKKIITLFLVIIFSFVLTNKVLAQTVKIPTIVKFSTGAKPEVAGLTQANTDVMVYIDDNFVGKAEVKSKGTATDNFYYQHLLALAEGEHKIMVIAADKASLVLSPPSMEFKFVVSPLSAPTLIKPNEQTVTAKVKPLIKGLTVNNTFVHVYIDGVYNGKTDLLSHQSGTANFAYQPFLNLEVGEHNAWAVAEDSSGRKSKPSSRLNFRIEEPMPAPAMFSPVVNSQTIYNQPFIVGLAKNDSSIRVYIDHSLDGQFKVENHQSGTANFAYQPPEPLTKGTHLLYTEATDSRGKVSSWSNLVYFTVQELIAYQPAISLEAVEEAKEVAVEIKESETKEEPAIIISPEQGTVETVEIEQATVESEKGIAEEEISEQEPGLFEEVKDKIPEQLEEIGLITKEEKEKEEEKKKEEIEKLIEEKKESGEELDDELAKIGLVTEEKKEEGEKTGLIDESKQKQGKLQLNLIIFIVFLVGVIAWILWVNRELIKERRTKGEKEEKKDPSSPAGESGQNLSGSQPGSSPEDRQFPPQDTGAGQAPSAGSGQAKPKDTGAGQDEKAKDSSKQDFDKLF